MTNESFWKHLVLGLRLTYGEPLRRRFECRGRTAFPVRSMSSRSQRPEV